LEPIRSILEHGRTAPAQIPKTGKPLYPPMGLGLFSIPQERLTTLRKSVEQVRHLQPALLRKASTTETMIQAVVKQHPSAALVFQKLVTGWCLRPIKSTARNVVEAFRQSNKAEPIIHNNVIPFIGTSTKGYIIVVQAFRVGLIKSRDDYISSVSPDPVCVVECKLTGLQVQDESRLAVDVRKLTKTEMVQSK
jgi:hypothetical protein